MEQMIYIKYTNNLFNLGYSHNNLQSKIISIQQIEILKHKLAILLDTNEIILYDTKSENFIFNKFNNFSIMLMKVYCDQLFIIYGSKLNILDQNTLEPLKTWEIGDNFYNFVLFKDYVNLSLDIIYVNIQNELRFYSKNLLFDAKYTNLYKENSTVDNILFQNELLIWSCSHTIKVFNLEQKKMILRKSYREINKSPSVSVSANDINDSINFLLFDNFLCLNVFQKIIYIYKIGPDTSVEEIFKSDDITNKFGTNYIGFWLNSSLTKISIIKMMPENDNFTERDSNKISNIKLEIFKINDNNNSLNNKTTLIHSKSFSHIRTYNTFKFTFSQKYSTVYIYDEKEIFFITLLDKQSKLIEDLKENKNLIDNFNEMYNIFNKGTNFNEKCYIVNKILRNLTLFIKNQIDHSKIVYMVNSVINDDRILDYVIQILINTNNLSHCYSWINKSFLKLKEDTKEKIIEHLISKNSFEILLKFITDQEKIVISDKFDKLICNLASNVVDATNADNSNSNSHSNSNSTKQSNLIYTYALINLKRKNYSASVEFLLKIYYKEGILDKIFNILHANDCEDLIFKFEKLFGLFTEYQLLELLDKIFNKDSDLKMCNNFYTILFDQCISEQYEKTSDPMSIQIKFISLIIENRKYYLIINKLIAEYFFDRLLKLLISSVNDNDLSYYNRFNNLILVFLDSYENFDHKEMLEKYTIYLNEKIDNFSSKLYDVLIILLNKNQLYERVINIYMDILKDPEKSIDYIENLITISDLKKEDLFSYLKNKIKQSSYLTSAKKMYFINLFQDNVLEDNQEISLLEELALSEDKNDIKFIHLLLEQLKFKVKILDLSLDISKKTLAKVLKKLKTTSLKGKMANLSNSVYCQYNPCESKKILKGDEIVCFCHCDHTFHKFCFNKINKYEQNEFIAQLNEDKSFVPNSEKDKSLIKIELFCRICSKTWL